MNANPINLARGLLDEIAGAVRIADRARKALAVSELKLVHPFLTEFDVSNFGADVAALKEQALADVADVLGVKATTK